MSSSDGNSSNSDDYSDDGLIELMDEKDIKIDEKNVETIFIKFNNLIHIPITENDDEEYSNSLVEDYESRNLLKSVQNMLTEMNRRFDNKYVAVHTYHNMLKESVLANAIPICWYRKTTKRNPFQHNN